MQEVIGSKEPESHRPFFSLPTGSSICYSDEVTSTLATLAIDGLVNLDNLSSSIQTVFGAEESPYQVVLAKRGLRRNTLLPDTGTRRCDEISGQYEQRSESLWL